MPDFEIAPVSIVRVTIFPTYSGLRRERPPNVSRSKADKARPSTVDPGH